MLITAIAWIPMIPFNARLVWFLYILLVSPPVSCMYITYASEPAKSSVEIWFAG